MKKIFLFSFLFLLFSTPNFAQITEPAKIKTSVEKISNTEYYLVFNIDLEKDWHLYSQYSDENGGQPIEITNEDSKEIFEIIGKAEESKTEKKYNKTFKVTETFFVNKATLKQKIKLLKDVNEVEVDFYGQVCKESCIPLDKPFTFKLNKTASGNSIKEEINPTSENNDDDDEPKKGLLALFLFSFLGGLAALFTPCVFPMIPLTVSFFTKQSKTRAAGIKNAIIYGLAIMAIYVLLGTLVTAIFGADAIYKVSSGVWFNVIFFFTLVIFAISFLGGFDISLPSSWGNKVDAQADRGGVIGILFMALALAIVSFSCTGPIAGGLLVQAASKGGIAPIIGMLGFSSAIALPFALFAMFPGWLNSLPKSGGWLNTVKVVLGFLELAFAFKFLSNADLVLQLHWLEREVFLAIWIAIFGALALYLFGKIKLPHDSPLTHISVGRLLLGLLTLSFTIYLIPGLWGAPLSLISGFPPPAHYSESPYGVGSTKENSSSNILYNNSDSNKNSRLPDGAYLLAPHNIMAFKDYEKGLAYAKQVSKPIMIDFTGHTCVNCRKMEDNVWPKSKILPILKNDVILISLYVDDRTKLPKDEQYVSEVTGSKIRTLGNKWSEFQQIKYKTNSQPYYVLINLDEKELNKPSGYNPNVDDYYDWLQSGLTQFKASDKKEEILKNLFSPK